MLNAIACCSSFLPQDKVAEFARLTPQELLKATQAAAGHEKLSTWHRALIEDGNRLRELVSVRLSMLKRSVSLTSCRVSMVTTSTSRRLCRGMLNWKETFSVTRKDGKSNRMQVIILKVFAVFNLTLF